MSTYRAGPGYVAVRRDLRMRYELVKMDEDVVHGAGRRTQAPDRPRPAGSLRAGRLRLRIRHRDLPPWQIQPTILFSALLSPQLELNTSAKAQVWLNGDGADNLLAFTVGLGVSPDLSRWAFRPEVGMLINPGEEGSFWHFSLGFSRTVGEAK